MVIIMIKKVIFDMDGLIFDSERVFMRELSEVARGYGYKVTEENYISSLGLNGDALYELKKSIYGEDYPHYAISRKTRERVDALALRGKLPVKDGIRELLEFLKENKIPCAVASSTHKRYVEKYLASAGLREYFSSVIGGDMASASKPDPEIFLVAAAATPPDECLVLEDSENGIKAASRAGMRVVCIPDMVYPSEDVKRLTAAVYNTAGEVIDYIRSDCNGAE